MHGDTDLLTVEGHNPSFYALRIALVLWTKTELDNHRIVDCNGRDNINQTTRPKFSLQGDLAKIEKLKGKLKDETFKSLSWFLLSIYFKANQIISN